MSPASTLSTTIHRPRDSKDIEDLVVSAREPFEIVGSGRARLLGRPAAAARGLDLSALSGILVYEPGELVITARAATPLADIEAALAQHGQHLAFEPPDLAPL